MIQTSGSSGHSVEVSVLYKGLHGRIRTHRGMTNLAKGIWTQSGSSRHKRYGKSCLGSQGSTVLVKAILDMCAYVLGSELWEDDFGSLLLIDVWECRKLKLYDDNACPGPQPTSGWDLGQDGKWWNGKSSRSGKLSHSR